MEKITLKAEKRDVFGKKTNKLRRENYIPAVLYGKGTKSVSLQIDAKSFEKIYKKAGSTTLIDLDIDGKNQKVLITDIQYHPVKDNPIHADLYAIKMDQEITANIPLEFVGISPAVKDMEGNLITNFDEIEVECLPGDLVSKIDVDITVLKTFDDQIKVSDLVVPEKIKVLMDPEEVIAVVAEPRSEEELAELETSGADTEKESIEKMEAQAKEEKEAKEKEKQESEENKE